MGGQTKPIGLPAAFAGLTFVHSDKRGALRLAVVSPHPLFSPAGVPASSDYKLRLGVPGDTISNFKAACLKR